MSMMCDVFTHEKSKSPKEISFQKGELFALSVILHEIQKNDEKKFDICVDDDNVDILDWIHSHFDNGSWHKHFEVTVFVKEIDYTEDGSRIYVDE